jgi:uncharacterized protein
MTEPGSLTAMPQGPVAPSDRLVILDVLRGGALFGVLASNIFALFSTRWILDRGTLDTTTLDSVAAQAILITIAGKAMTMLTFLFGLGFAMQLLGADERGEDARPLFVRRLAALFLFGAAHVTLFWWGDVTWGYALCGFALLAFRRRSPRALLAWVVALLVIPLAVTSIPGVRDAARELLPHAADPKAFRAELLTAIHGTDHVALAWAQLRHAVYYSSAIAVWYFPWLLARFLLGYYAGRRRLFDGDGAANLPLFRRLLAWGLALAVAGVALHQLLGSSLMADHELLPVGRFAVGAFSELTLLGHTAAYASLTVLLLRRPTFRRLLLVVAPVGRMPLTTYLSQSVAATFVFYGWGLDRAGHTGAAACFGISLAIFALQIAAAHLWLRRFRFGPAEWLWRTLAYGRRQPMRA